MKEFRLKRSHEYNEYFLTAEGYIPKELEEDLEDLLEDFAYDEDLLVEEAYEKIKELKKFYKKRNGIIMGFGLDLDYNTYEHSVRVLTIGIHSRRSILQFCKEKLFCLTFGVHFNIHIHSFLI